MEITSQNLEETKSKYDDNFVNYWVPVIRKLREKHQFASLQMSISMNECLAIFSKALSKWEKVNREII